jgi:hypothetical protein
MTQYNVYKIINDDMPGLVYYGSTMNTLNKRFFGHKNSKRYKSSKLFEIGEPKIIQLHVFDNELDMYKKEKEYLYALVKSVSVIQDCLFDIAKRLQELENPDGDK